MMEGCGGNRQSGNENDTFITVDVRASYPEKELILQDFMDVEYIALETSDDFLCQGRVLDIGKDIILVRNDVEDGDIFIFDRNGKGIRKINRRGNGGEEYTTILGVALDEDNGEIFVNDIIARNIMVYDLYGKFKRRLRHNEEIRYNNIYNFDRKYLICEVTDDSQAPDKTPFIIISKQDGCAVNKTHISYKQKKSTKIDSNNSFFIFYPYYPILPFHGSWILSEASSDTVFRFLPDYSMIPFMARTPSIQSMYPEVFLFPKILTDRYYFMEKVKKENNFLKIDLIYDKQEKAIYEYALYNDDYSNKQRISMVTWETKNDEVAFWQKIESYELVESYKKGELKSKLKEFAAGLEENSNPVIMLVKNKRAM
jgi:hypothetical protein